MDRGLNQILFNFTPGSLYDNVDEYTTNVGDAIIVIAQYQYEYGFVVDKEICVAAMLNKLLKL